MIPKIYFVGTAGAGKSTMVNAFKEWITQLSYDAITVNLDPGAEYLPYTPDIDIREDISLEGVMSEYNLGPNGAQIVSADLMVEDVQKIKDLVESYDSDYVLIDAPGQLELFAFRESSREIIRQMDPEASSMIYLFDASLLKTASGYISSHFLAMSVLTRFSIPFLPVISKADLLVPEERRNISKWESNSGELLESLREERATIDIQFAESIISSVKSLDIIGAKLPISSVNSEGLDQLYSYLQGILEGGEDLEKR